LSPSNAVLVVKLAAGLGIDVDKDFGAFGTFEALSESETSTHHKMGSHILVKLLALDFHRRVAQLFVAQRTVAQMA
jgi:hypothetical protein